MAREQSRFGAFLLLLGLALLGISGYLSTTQGPVALWALAPGTVISTLRPSTHTSVPVARRNMHPGAFHNVEHRTAPGASEALAAAAGDSEVKGTIVVIGATGLTGAEAVFQGLARGYKVVGLARNPSKLVVPAGSGGADGGQPLADGALTMIQGSVTNKADVMRAFEADDIAGVVVALGGKTSEVGKTMLTDGTSNIIEAMKAKGLKRIAVVTSIGAGDSEKQAPFFFRVLMGTVMRGVFEDKNNQEALFLQGPGADLEYTIVRPGGLTVNPPTGQINVIDGEAGSIARADVASFCLDAILDPEWKYIGKTPCISSLEGTSWTKDRSAAARGA